MQHVEFDLLQDRPLGTLPRLGLAIVAVICFLVLPFLIWMWFDAEGFWRRVIAAALPPTFFGIGAMSIHAVVTGRVRLGWLFGPIAFVAAASIAMKLLG